MRICVGTLYSLHLGKILYFQNDTMIHDLRVSNNSIHYNKKSRSLAAKNFGSVDQRAAKLIAVNVGVL